MHFSKYISISEFLLLMLDPPETTSTTFNALLFRTDND